ncbi:glycosyltransferase family 39 protein [Methanobacterium petrolearium]|uniref:glycosyltransferase family 39 protein n=1 Tax=Methanobacterium petrolearium TaxID=710190 RepID=UPI001AEB675A|nr:glycosyltransferase family 39 protein [Methanobacterium petrolearium]
MKLNGSFCKSNNKYIFIIILILIVASLAYYRVLIQIEIGSVWDTYAFLSNAMYFAGQGFGYTELTRPPFLPFLTSLLFRLGFVYESTIYYLDAFFLVFGAVGLYLFFRMKFEPIISFFGSLLFSTFPVVILFAGIGLSDIPSVALSIWALYTTVLAVKRDSKFFYLSFPLGVLAFLTRYPAGFIVFPMLFYLIINRKSLSIKPMIGGILLSLLPGIMVILFFHGQFGDPFYPFETFYNTTQKSWATTYVYYCPNPLYFLQNILYYMGPGGITIVLFFIFSLISYTITQFSTLQSKFKGVNKYKITKYMTFTMVSLIILLILLVLSFTKINYFLSEVLFFIVLLLVYSILKGEKIQDMDFHFLFISWFMAFFIFHSIYTVKDDRYFVTMAPALSYFLILAFNYIGNLWTLKEDYQKLIYRMLIIVLVVMIISSAVFSIHEIPDNESQMRCISNDVQAASQWLKDDDHQYNSKMICSERCPQLSWYLRTNVLQMPLCDTTGSCETQLNRDKIDYYFSFEEMSNFTEYQQIKHFGVITIYKRRS